MSDSTPDGPPRTAGGGPMTARMQALLSQHAEEQLVEQRQVSTLLGELRTMVAGLGEQLRGAASSARLDSIDGDLVGLANELRSSAAGLGDRLDGLARRVDDQASSTAEVLRGSGQGTEALAVRVTALGSDITASAEAVDRLAADIGALSSFPDALGVLQREVSGLHDRLAPLVEVRTGLADLTARTGALEALRPDVAAVQQRLEGLVTGDELARARDSLSATLGERIDRLETALPTAAVTPQQLMAALEPLQARLDEAGAAAPVLGRIDGLDSAVSGLAERIDSVGERLSDIGDAAGGVPALATDVGALSRRLDELGLLRNDLAAVRTSVTALSEDSLLPSLVLGVATLREDVEDLAGRVGEISLPTAASVATAVSQQLTDRIVDALAPRVADLVLTRVAATLVAQVSGSVTSSVQDGLTERVRTATADSERRIVTHVDEAVLALAEALLRRRRPTSRSAAAALDPVSSGGPAAGDRPNERIADDLRAPLTGPLTGRAEPAEPGMDEGAAADDAEPLDPEPHESGTEPEGVEPAPSQAPGEPDAGTAPDAADEARDHAGGGHAAGDPATGDLATGDWAAEDPAAGDWSADDLAGDDLAGDDLAGEDPADLDEPPASIAPQRTVEPEAPTAQGTAEGTGLLDRGLPDGGSQHEPAPQADPAPGRRSDVADEAAPTAAQDSSGDAAPLVDSSPAPASAFRSFVLPRTEAAATPPAPDPVSTPTDSATPPAPPTPSELPDDDASAPRRPWWRPGG